MLFSPLASNYSNAVTDHLYNSQALAGVKKSDFFCLFYKSWTKVFTTELVQWVFKVAAIHPQNRDSVVDRFRKLTLEQARTPSLFVGSEWQEANQVFNSLVKDPAAEAAKKLKRSLHHMAA